MTIGICLIVVPAILGEGFFFAFPFTMTSAKKGCKNGAQLCDHFMIIMTEIVDSTRVVSQELPVKSFKGAPFKEF